MDLPLQELLIDTRQRRFSRERIHNPRVEPLSKQGQQFEPHAISRDADIVVRDVVYRSEAALLQERADGFAGTVQQRTDHDSVAWVHRGKPTGAGASDQPKQKGFRLVVARMTQRDDIGVLRGNHLLEEGVSGKVRRVLNGPVFRRRQRGDVDAFLGERKPQ